MFSWYKYLIVNLVFFHLGFWSGNLLLIAPFPDLCLLVPFLYYNNNNDENNHNNNNNNNNNYNNYNNNDRILCKLNCDCHIFYPQNNKLQYVREQ